MGAKIISRSYSKQGLDNWDKIFGKKKIKKIVPSTTVEDKCSMCRGEKKIYLPCENSPNMYWEICPQCY